MKAFTVDLFWNGKPINLADLEVCVIDEEDLIAEMRLANAKTVYELDDYDRMHFETEEQAEHFVEVYQEQMRELIEYPFGYTSADFRKYPMMAYRRHMLVLTLLNMKLQTYRNYNTGWKPGQLFTLHDRTHYVTVRLNQIVKEGTQFKYEFENI